MWYFQIKFDMVCTSRKLFPSLVKKGKNVQKLFVYSPRHQRACRPEKEKNNYLKFFKLRYRVKHKMLLSVQDFEVWSRTNNAFNATCITDWTLGCKTLGVLRGFVKSGRKNRTDLMTIITKEIKNTSQIRWFSSGTVSKIRYGRQKTSQIKPF